MSRFTFYFSGLWLALSAASVGASPNFLIILCDDLGYGDLGCYGHPAIKTPHLDQMAKEGIRLTSCYASAPVCSPSRAGMLTGRTPSRVGVYDWIPANHVCHLPRSEVTVATLLQKSGYQTAHVGKWHCNGKFNQAAQPQPGDQGFDHWFSTQNNARPSHQNPRNFVRNGKQVGPLKGFACQLVADEAIEWLKKRKEKPFFLHVCFHEPHEPVASPPDLVKQYKKQAKNDNQAQYFANVANMDAAVGRLMKTLNQLNLDKNTLVFFTSDNGPETLNRYRGAQRSYGSPGDLRAMKLWLYEGGIRVPGILRWTGKIKPGQVSSEPVCGVDVLPTFCELAGARAPRDRKLDGSSFAPVLQGKPVKRAVPLYWHYFNSLGQPKAAMRVGDWMILGHREGPNRGHGRNVNPMTMKRIKSEKLAKFELYDLKSDLKQQQNLAKKHPEKLKELSQRLIARHREVQQEGKNWTFPPKP